MVFVWDEQKNEKNIAKHGVDFVDAEVVFQNNLFVCQDKRIISLRKANRGERKTYEEAKKNL